MAWFGLLMLTGYNTGDPGCLAQETPQSVKPGAPRPGSLTPQTAVWYHSQGYCPLQYPESGPQSCWPGSK